MKSIVDEQWVTPQARFAIVPANRDGDDVVCFSDERRGQEVVRFQMLRQQNQKKHTRNHSLADFIAPFGTPDWMGAFCVTVGSVDERAKQMVAELDDYSAIMLKALADRLAEAFAEYLHQLVRQTYWGYEQVGTFDNDSLIQEVYQGIRPAPGYPACPDHSQKQTLFEWLDIPNTIGVELTESMAMTPASSVSGWYFAHPQTRYFGVGKLNASQVEDYAHRRGWTVEEALVWLGNNYNG